MQEKDKIRIKDELEGTLDVVLSNIPGINIAWGFCKVWFGSVMQLRQDRVNEY